ncbi:MAG: lysozyme [Burkholderiaceae bacterium]|nr:lysozyme [Burkholderiaceae bacterium]
MSNDDGSQRQSASSWSFSDAGMTLLKSAEALFLQPYDDQTERPTSVWVPGATIGYGHLIAKTEWDKYSGGITADDAATLLAQDLAPTVTAVQNAITAAVTQNEFDAMVILTFNIGATAFASSSVAKLVNDPSASTQYPSLEGAWKAWDISQGKVMAGLANRRQCEWNVYANGIYQHW